METLEWFRVEKTDAGIIVEFAPGPNQYWPPEVLGVHPLDLEHEAAANGGVHVAGRGSVWMYAAAGAAAGEAGAELTIDVPAIFGRVRAARHGERTAIDAAWLERIQPADDPSRLILRFRPSGPESISESDEVAGSLRSFAASACRGIDKVVLTGRGPAWGYAALAAGAVDGGVERVLFFSPVDHVPIVCWSHAARGPLPEPPAWLLDSLGYERDARPGLTVGVIGDPNSGKSVFSMLLERAFAAGRADAVRAFRYDCDRASPTPYWFLRMQARSTDDPAPRQLREAAKQKWTPEMERSIAAALVRLRAYFPVVVADLPGGNHKITPPARIPPGREVIMREIDRFVLVARDEAAVVAWREALATHGLADRLIAIVETRDPQIPLSLSQVATDANRRRITGLDRSVVLPLLASSSPAADAAWKSLADQIVGGGHARP